MKPSGRSFFRRIQTFGTHSGMDELELRHAALINLFILFATPAFIGSTIQTYITDGVQLGHVMLAFNLIFLFVIVLVAYAKFLAAEYYLMAVVNLILFYFNNTTGYEGGAYLFYFPFLMMLAFLADFRRFRLFSIHVIVTVIFVILGVIFQNRLFYAVQPVSNLKTSFLFNFVTSVCLCGFCTFIVMQITYQQYYQFKLREVERRRNELSMKGALREKETLLAEIHHRVKNNLAVISSMLNLQMNTVTNEYTRNVLRETRNRVASMALIHQKLYLNNDVEEIDFDTYIKELVDEIRQSYPYATPGNVSVSIDAQRIPMNLNKAIPCGLLLNELLSNCYKHAFAENGRGDIDIRFGIAPESRDMYELIVTDNGKGLPKDFRIEELTSLGITIIESLTDQMDGKLSWTSEPEKGTSFRIVFLKKDV